MHQWLPKPISRKPVLTNGAVPAILENHGLYNETPILQVLSYKGLLQSTNDNRYKLVLSDGKYSYAFVMLAAQLNHLIADEKMETFAVIKVVRFSVNSIAKKTHGAEKVYSKIITLHDVELMVPGKEIGGKLGNPQEFHYGEEIPEDLLTNPIKPVCLGNTTVERIRPGLICVHSKWEKKQMKDTDKNVYVQSSYVHTSSFKKLRQPQTQSSFCGISPAGSSQNYSAKTKTSSIPLFTKTSSNVRDSDAQQTQSVSTNHKSINAVPTPKEDTEYIADFVIDGQHYKFKASFVRSNKKIVGSLTLSQGSENSNSIVKRGIDVNGAIEKRKTDLNQPRAVWVNLNGVQKKFSHLKKSWISDRYWVSDKFDGSFLFQSSESSNWTPLTGLLWMEFETVSGGERNALQQLTQLYVQQNQCDVQFSFEGDSAHIGGHSNILAARSPVFAAMFQHEMKETKTGKVSIQDIKIDIFKQLLHYVYSGRLLTPLTEATAQPLFVAADKYDVVDLKEECVSFLLTCIRVDNVINLLSFADRYFVEELTKLALKFTVLNAKEICILKDWEELTKNYPFLCVLITRQITGRMSISLNDEEELICSGLNFL